MVQDSTRWLSEAEFLAQPESTERIELIDGEVIVSPSVPFAHQRLVGRLCVALDGWAAENGAEVGIAPLDIRFGPSRILQPDLAVFLGGLPADVEMPLARVPELCIEVLSTNRDYDRRTKRLVYADAGVVELWLVAPEGQIERWSGEKLAGGERAEDPLRSPVLNGFELPFGVLFR
ncbi:MAG: Uma2 family endonuclease [Myxococcota bacterium]